MGLDITTLSSKELYFGASNVYDGGRTNHSSLHATPITLQPIAESNSSLFFDELKIATKNFQPNNLIGECGFGYVYKDWIDKKTLSTSKPQFGMAVAINKHRCTVEGLQELKYLGLLHHPHIVELIGFCLDGGNLVLVYEFLSQGGLEDHLFRYVLPPLSWTTRIKVAVGAAKGLDFLHSIESNLYIEFNAKISDFGLARIGPIGDRSHVSTLAMGMEGYAAPEHITKGLAFKFVHVLFTQFFVITLGLLLI
ncbi:putative serine/threonine-protein kinase PBL4 [Bienertia sinuspersici]